MSGTTSTNPQAQTFTGADISMFHIALKQMGDPLQWYRIAAANAGVNGIPDPVITGTVNWVIPQPDPTNDGGIPPQ